MLGHRARHSESAGSRDDDGAPDVFEAIADCYLQRAALVARVQRDRAPDPLAGLKVDDADLQALLLELPGLEPGDAGSAQAIERQLAPGIERVRAEFAAKLSGESKFARLVRSAALGPLEAEIFAVLCAVEVDPRRQRLVGYLNDDVTQRRLTLWSLFELFGRSEALVSAVGPNGGLRRAVLLAPAGSGPFAAEPIALAPAVLWWLKGEYFFDPELPPGAEYVNGPGVGSSTRVVAAGPDRIRRLQAILDVLDAPVALVVRLPAERAGWDAVVRQATLAEAGVVLEVDDDLSAEARERIERAGHLAWAVSSPLELPLGSLFRGGWTEAEVAPADATDKEWDLAFPGLDRASDPGSPNYRLSAEQLRDVRLAASALDGDVQAAVRRLAAGHIDTTAMRIRPSRSWQDLVLDEDRMSAVQEIAVRHRRRDVVFEQWGFSKKPSTGVVALFAGPSGTGKTLAAEIIAGDLGVDLYKIDLANLVSKYIGETEKNLSRIFDAAEASRVVLFFDEADALLGKRSEVSDAHDRYANIEVAYLLQRLEAYDGVAVMATNLANNLDQAFLRRLHVVVEFPLPQAPERRKIWARSFPPGAPLSPDLDLDHLADEIEISGGTIRNVTVRAAFLAAELGQPIGMDVVVLALRREFEKIGRLTSASEWGRIFEGRR